MIDPAGVETARALSDAAPDILLQQQLRQVAAVLPRDTSDQGCFGQGSWHGGWEIIGEVVEGFRLKPVRRLKQFSDHLGKLHLEKVALQQSRPTVSLCLASRRHTTTAETAVDGSRAQPPQLLKQQEFAMDRSHPTPRAREKPVRLQARENSWA